MVTGPLTGIAGDQPKGGGVPDNKTGPAGRRASSLLMFETRYWSPRAVRTRRLFMARPRRLVSPDAWMARATGIRD
jgi:hypothetical protein